MSLARLVATAVVLEGRTKSEVARDYRVSLQWVHELIKRFDAEGEAGLEPRSRRLVREVGPRPTTGADCFAVGIDQPPKNKLSEIEAQDTGQLHLHPWWERSPSLPIPGSRPFSTRRVRQAIRTVLARLP